MSATTTTLAIGIASCALISGLSSNVSGHATRIGSVEVRNGVALEPLSGSAPVASAQLGRSAALGSGFIDFDDASEPCSFSETTALRTQYLAQGVSFIGRGPKHGGAILDECGNFGVTGHSSPNFLAFNIDAFMADGGIPRPPQYIRFAVSLGVSHVDLKIGSSLGGTATLIAFDASGAVVDVDSVPLGSALQPLAIDAPGIVGVEINAPGVPYFVVDDLTYN